MSTHSYIHALIHTLNTHSHTLTHTHTHTHTHSHTHTQVCPYDPNKPAWQLDELARAMQEEERKPNPVVQRVKIIMAMGLTVVHLHSRFLSGMTGLSLGLGSPLEEGGALLGGAGGREDEIEKVPLTEYLWWKTFNLSVDQVGTECVMKSRATEGEALSDYRCIPKVSKQLRYQPEGDNRLRLWLTPFSFSV